MQKKLLIIADPLSKLNLLTDSSLALAEVALSDHWAVTWCETKHVQFLGSQIILEEAFQLTEASSTALKYQPVRQKKISFVQFDFCFVRKDPPFDEEYKNLCWILNTQTQVKIVNPVDVLLSYHEKALQWRAFSEGVLRENEIIPTCLSSSVEVIEDFCKSNAAFFRDGFVSKPWLGHGGEDVQFYSHLESLLQSLKSLNQRLMVQPFLKEVAQQGDRRVLIAGGEVIGDFVRIPPAGKIASNLSQGGRAVLQEMSFEQKDICLRLGVFLKKKNILFAGLDLISNYVGEINITSPTGLKTYETLTGKNIARKAFQLLTS